MNRKYRKPLMIANWKMNKTPSETTAYIKHFWALISELRRSTVVVCVPAVCVSSAVSAARKTRIRIGAEDCHMAKSGPHTGEVSAEMYLDAGCGYVVLELTVSNAVQVNGKLRAALDAGIQPILCVRDESRASTEENWQMAYMLELALRDIPKGKLRDLVIAYQLPGLEDLGTPEQVELQCAFIRAFLRKHYSARDAQFVPILYAGEPSVETAKAFLTQKNIDGFLVYLAGLEPGSFASLIATAEQL